MEPRIQYAKTSDGVNIAYWTIGQGISLVCMPNVMFSNVELEWRFLEERPWQERLAETARLIRYDGRGTGLSDRDAGTYGLDSRILDLEAVVEELKLERFALWGNFHSGPVAIAYAVRYPARVSHLIIEDSYARFPDLARSPRYKAMSALIDQDWETYTETVAHVVSGWSGSDSAHRWADLIRQNITPETARAAQRAVESFDVTPLLNQVSCPTMVVHLRGRAYPDLDAVKALAAGIPGCHLVLVERAPGDLSAKDAIVPAIEEFLGEREAPSQLQLPSGTAVILFADIVDSTALTERIGDTAFRDKARELDGSLRAVIREAGGTPVEGKLLGDGVLAVFGSAAQAIEAALACGRAGDEVALPLHLGLHAGDVIREADNVYGGAVNIAARVAAAAHAGETLVSGTVRDLARTSAGVSFEDRGEQALKGIDDPVRVFAVRALEGG